MKILEVLDRAVAWLLGDGGPARWRDDPALDATVARHPAGKGLRPGDPSP